VPGSACTDPLQDLMFCMTPFVNPYLGTPVFWWDSLNDEDRDEIKALPNFDAEIFRECTGIRIC